MTFKFNYNRIKFHEDKKACSLIFILSLLVSFFVTKVGTIITADSIVYLSVAENLSKGNGLMAYNGEAFSGDYAQGCFLYRSPNV